MQRKKSLCTVELSSCNDLPVGKKCPVSPQSHVGAGHSGFERHNELGIFLDAEQFFVTKKRPGTV
jgi:hypothetical protein